MGFDYAYEIVTPRQCFERLLRTIAGHLVPKDGDRLLSALSKRGDRAIQAVQRDALEAPLFEKGFDDLCLTFLFPTDERLVAYGGIEQLSDPKTGRIAIGCV